MTCKRSTAPFPSFPSFGWVNKIWILNIYLFCYVCKFSLITTTRTIRKQYSRRVHRARMVQCCRQAQPVPRLRLLLWVQPSQNGLYPMALQPSEEDGLLCPHIGISAMQELGDILVTCVIISLNFKMLCKFCLFILLPPVEPPDDWEGPGGEPGSKEEPTGSFQP